MSILERIFRRRGADAPDTRPLSRFEASVIASRPSNTDGSPSAERAAEMLAAPDSVLHLSMDEARVVVRYMRPRRIAEGVTFIREGDDENTGFMLLVIDGEVSIESSLANRAEPLTVTVLGPGSVIGEMGLIDGAPRSASCTAITDLRAGVLTREALNRLLDREPRIAAKLVMAISRRMAERMRGNQGKIKMYSQLTQALNEEMRELMPL